LAKTSQEKTDFPRKNRAPYNRETTVNSKWLIILIKSIPCSQRRTSIFGGIASFLAAICVRRVVLPMLKKNVVQQITFILTYPQSKFLKPGIITV